MRLQKLTQSFPKQVTIVLSSYNPNSTAAGMGDEYDKRRNSYAVPSYDNAYASELVSTWGGQQQYNAWDHGNKAGKFGPFPGSFPPPPGADGDGQQRAQEPPPVTANPTMSAPGQHWYGYYAPQQSQERGQVSQGGLAAPPLPTMPPPQPPLPPNSATAPAWAASEQGGAHGGTDTTYSNYYSHPHHQQLGQEYAGYGVGESQPANNPTSSVSHSQATSVPANGSQPYGQGYAGYNAVGEQFAYGNTNYQGYNNYGYPQQGTESYPQNTATYANAAAAPYTPLSQYQNSSSHTDTTSYPSTATYYDSTSYQSTAYQQPGYSEQPPNSWSDPNYGNYNYTGYVAPDSNTNAAYVAPNANSDDATQYPQQDYQQQWADYYASLQTASQAPAETSVAPQAAPGVSTAAPVPTYASVVAAPPSQQPPPPGTVLQPSWQSTAVSYYASQPSQQVSSTMESSSAGAPWNTASTQTSQSDLYKQSHFPPLGQQPRTPASTQAQQQSVAFEKAQAALNLQQQQNRITKLQIPTNPRIVPNAGGLGSAKETQKPAYISVPTKQSSSHSSTDAVADATLQPGMFPPSLRAYVERALSRCKDEAQKAACQGIMKEMITKASLDGTLFTKDWDTEPLFQLPTALSSSNKKESFQQHGNSAKLERSPARRLRTRWEPLGADDAEEKQGRSHTFHGIFKEGHQDLSKESDHMSSPSKWEKQEESWSKSNSTLNQQSVGKKISKRGMKRLRKGILNFNGGLKSSSESEEEEHNDGVYLGSLSTAETPEEKKRRQNRTKRFDRGKDSSRGGKGSGRGRGPAGGSASARRATALQLALNSGDGQNGRAVEDIDWDSLTVRGTCQEVEKRYLRLTSAPDPHTVRPEDVLWKALAMVQTTPKSYLYKCEQLKSIRQDLTVQRIRNEFTVQVYETHARMALEAGDLPEYNQCQTQLKGLYAEGIKGCINEFAAYSLLYIVFHRGNSRDLLSAMARLTREGKEDEVVKHALAVRTAVAVGNYTTFFRLYRTAPNLSPFLMDLYIEKMRFEAVKCMARSYRPTIPVSFVARTLGFNIEVGSEGETDGLDECEEWLRGHGSHLQYDSVSSELVMDAKMSASSLFMPEPEDVVPHGDANLALNDFFARS